MTYLKYSLQLIIIMMFLYAGEFLSGIIEPVLVIPGSIVGMLLLFIALLSKIIPLSAIEETSQFFLKHMGFFFIPLGVSVIESYVLMQSVVIELILILSITNILVMGITSKITDLLIKKQVNHD